VCLQLAIRQYLTDLAERNLPPSEVKLAARLTSLFHSARIRPVPAGIVGVPPLPALRDLLE
jgi:hypothetical protein